MIKNAKKLETAMVDRARELAKGCKKVFVAVSGGIDSSLVAAILCRAFRPENVVGLYRNIRSNPAHLKDVKFLQSKFAFRLIYIDGNYMYDEFLRQCRKEFKKCGMAWIAENSPDAERSGFTNAYASLKSRFTTPMAGFIAKAIDTGHGRIFGTGNGEEDGLLRYFDKYGDGAVDNNILNGLTKGEVRQLARHMGVPEKIITKIPSADLESTGNQHNDEAQLTTWARRLHFDISVSYGSSDGRHEGNIAWAWKEDIKRGVITGKNARKNGEALSRTPFRYLPDQIAIILFLREIERVTRHKVSPIPGLDRSVLIKRGLVD